MAEAEELHPDPDWPICSACGHDRRARKEDDSDPDEQDPCFQHLKDCFYHFSKTSLKIRTKEDGVQPFKMNSAQRYIHDIAERQRRETGRVRIIVLKGRQQGMSTYIEGRFYWKVIHEKGQRAYILTHEAEATNNLFAMASRYHENCPPEIRPSTDRDSGKELNFDVLDSGYKVGTAGTKGTGRSSTIQYFHGSEVAFWSHAETHATGVLQAVPRNQSEVWLESTSEGMGNYFHQMWVGAVAGTNDFEAVFIPWHWQEEYQLPYNGEEFYSSGDDEQPGEVELMEMHNISPEHMMWRRWKVGELPQGEDQFKREYPNDPQEAFESAGYKQLIPSAHVGRALRHEGIEARGPMVMGVDPARFGDDRLAIAIRQGRVAWDIVAYPHTMDQMAIAGLVKQILDSMPIERCFIDEGMGVGVIDRLHEMNYQQVQGVNFGAGAWDSSKYINRRNEMWQEMADWFADDHVQLFPMSIVSGDADIDKATREKAEAATMDLCAVEYKFNSNNLKVLEDKDKTKERLQHSPDMGDALALTFAEPVAEYLGTANGRKNQGRNPKTGY